jgi:hypothetical protein
MPWSVCVVFTVFLCRMHGLSMLYSQLRAYRGWARLAKYHGNIRRAYRTITSKYRAQALERVWEGWVQATRNKLTSWGKLWQVRPLKFPSLGEHDVIMMTIVCVCEVCIQHFFPCTFKPPPLLPPPHATP